MGNVGASRGRGDSAGKKELSLPPDSAILMNSRVKSGERAVPLRNIANLVLHDPVLTIDFLQHANSPLYSGAPVTDIDGALARMGISRIINLLGQLNPNSKIKEECVQDMLETLRYNCRRASIVSLIIAAATRPNLAALARVCGLFSDIGHMVALMKLGKTYCDLAKEAKRKNLPHRLQKEHHMDVAALRLKYLGSKGLPKTFIIAYNLAEEARNTNEAELRCIIQSAHELIDAYDSSKFAAYAPDKGLPVQSTLRLLGLNSVQHTRVFKAVGDYLKTSSDEEAPKGASFLCTPEEEEETKVVGNEDGGNGIRVPVYPHSSVNARSRDRLQDFFELCERERNLEELKRKAAEYLSTSGLFKRTALIRVGESKAAIDFSAGLTVPNGGSIVFSDNESLFGLFTVQIRSVKLAATVAPFGVSAFAIGPVDMMPSGERLVLYADVLDSQILPMESRRVFRLALGLLVRSVQTLKSGGDSASTIAAP